MRLQGQRDSALRRAVDRLLDGRFGLVRMLVENPREPGAPEFFHFYAEAGNTEALGAEPNFRDGGGASTSRDGAMFKALGETIERYCAAFYKQDDCPFTPYASAPFPCIAPETFARYRPDQVAAGNIEFIVFTDDVPVRWTPVRDATSGEIVYVPAALVFMPYMYEPAEGEFPIAQPISTGLACNEGYEAACVSGASEAIERDAFSIFWQATLPPPRVRLDSLDPENADRIARFGRARYDVTLFDVTTDIPVPAVMAVARHDDESQPALVIAAAAHPIASTAIRKCLEELEHTRAWCRTLKATVPLTPNLANPLNITTQRDHLRFWCEHSNLHCADWLFASQTERDFDDLAGITTHDPVEQLAFVRESLESAGLRLLIADLTTPDIEELDLNVVRAVIPGLNPLVIGHAKRMLGGRRLHEVPGRLGYATPAFELDADAHPHPFP